MNRGVVALAAFLVLVLTPGARAQAPFPSIPGDVPALPGAGSIPSAGALPGAGSLPSAGALPGVGSLPSAGALPGVGSLPAAGAAVPAAVPAAAPASPNTIWSFFGLSKSNLAMCKAKFCSSQLGTLVNSGMQPLSALTGGIIGGCCPPPTPAQLAAAAAAGGAEGVAAKIKAEEADAKARIAAIEYLATVDCRYWPEAEGTLVERLRADRNECVRYAAARALGTGCCCTKKTIAALKLVVECTDSDGNPPERSERVKAAAWYALSHCVGRYVPPPPAPRERPSESPRREYPASYQLNPRAASYEAALADTPDEALLDDARRVLAAARNAPLGEGILPTGSRSVLNAMVKASAPVAAPKGRRPVVEIRSTAPPYSPAPPVAPIAAPDRSVLRAAAEVPAPPRRRPPRSLLDVFSASRRSQPGG